MLSIVTLMAHIYLTKSSLATSVGTVSGPLDALIDGGITFNALSVTTWNHTKLNHFFWAQLVK